MTEHLEKLKKLDNDKLIDVVKNYRQYGYEEQLREAALQILAERGISKEQLQITGNYENKSYNFANDLFDAYMKNSKIAFVMYLVLLASRILFQVIPEEAVGLAWTALIVSIISLLLYFGFLILSFMNQSQYYKALGSDYGTDGALLYLFIGMPFYLVMYFFFRNQMKEKLNEIR